MYNQKAFPMAMEFTGDYTKEKCYQEGMDLRDYFAAKAMQSILSQEIYDIPILDIDVKESPNGRYTKNEVHNRYYYNSASSLTKDKTYEVISTYEERIARESYKIADAMLKVREEK